MSWVISSCEEDDGASMMGQVWWGKYDGASMMMQVWLHWKLDTISVIKFYIENPSSGSKVIELFQISKMYFW